jgi:hypothetical protein
VHAKNCQNYCLTRLMTSFEGIDGDIALTMMLEWASNDFDVGQSFPISDLRESHRQKLIPTRGVIDLVVTGAAIDTATKLFWMDPVSELRKNQFSSGHAPKVGMATA